jgi:Domain of unknown function (DUF383)
MILLSPSQLVGLLRDKSPVVRQLALENLLPYTQAGNPHLNIWQRNNWEGARLLKILARDSNVNTCHMCSYSQTPKTPQQAIAALINLSSREESLRASVIDAPFLEYTHSIITDKTHKHADLACMLLSNLSKSPQIKVLLEIKVPEREGLAEKTVLGQLMEIFVLGENKRWNENATFDFLGNVWGDMSRVDSSVN